MIGWKSIIFMLPSTNYNNVILGKKNPKSLNSGLEMEAAG